MNKFLQSIRKSTLAGAVDIDIEGTAFKVRKISTHQNLQIFEDAKRLALNSGNTTKATKKEIEATIGMMGKDIDETARLAMFGAIETKGDIERIMSQLRIASKLIAVESVITTEGAKIYENEQERKAVMDALFSDPETMQKVENALAQIADEQEKKAHQNGTPTPVLK